MKRVLKKILFLCCFIFLCACGQAEHNEVTEKDSSTLSITFVPKSEDTSMSNENDSENYKADYIEIEVESPVDVTLCNAMNRKLSRETDSGASLFCLEENTETIYFVNQNQDNYLYCIKEGIVELVVELPVKEVYPYNGVVYFMIDSYGMYDLGEKKDGNIYKYIPETKEVQLVYPAGAIEGSENHKMTVNEQGIYFNYSEPMGSENGLTRVKVSSYYLPFDATEPVKDTEKLGKHGWNDYYFSYQFLTEDRSKRTDLVLVNRTKGTEDVLALGIDAFEYCVAGDTLYSTTLGSFILSLTDLSTQEVIKLNFSSSFLNANLYTEEEKKKVMGEGIEQIRSFTVTDDGNIVWTTDGEYLYRMDKRSSNELAINFETIDAKRRIEELYTDGRDVYALYASSPKETPRMVRFCTKGWPEVEKRHNGALIFDVEYLVPEGGL